MASNWQVERERAERDSTTKRYGGLCIGQISEIGRQSIEFETELLLSAESESAEALTITI